MTKKILIAIAFVWGIPPYAQAQLTNQALITPSLRFQLLEASAGMITNRFNSNDQIRFMVTTTDENGHVFALLRPEQSFIFELLDAKGRSVSKTEIGLKMSKSVDIAKGPRDLEIRHNPVSPNHAVVNNLFIPDNYFIITEKGSYTLDVQIRAWVQETNNQYGVVISPPVRVEIDKH